MSRSDGGLRFGRRLKAKLLGELPIWGLKTPARLSWEDGAAIDCAEQDRDLVHGFAAAAAAMPAMDLQRRLWSGRLAELVGERPVQEEISAADLDVFVRLLGFREEAERGFKTRPDTHSLQAFARGVNAWIDSGHWQKDPAWTQLRSRPRLWGAADSLLLATAPARVDGSRLAVPRVAGWPDAWTARLSSLWACLHGDLRAPGGPGGPLEFRGIAPPAWPASLEVDIRGGTFDVVPVEVIEGGDNHRYAHGDGVRRLRARRHDVAVRGAAARHPWIRRSAEGPLISDLLAGAEAPTAPAGPAFALRWIEGARPGAPLREPLPADHPWRLPSSAPPRPLRLVPMEGGA